MTPAPLPAYVEGEAASIPLRRRSAGAALAPSGAAPPAPPDISFGGLTSLGSAAILVARAAEIAPCPDFDKEVLIFSHLIGPFRHFKCKTGPGRGEKRANGPKILVYAKAAGRLLGPPRNPCGNPATPAGRIIPIPNPMRPAGTLIRRRLRQAADATCGAQAAPFVEPPPC